jgi:hypothetical protein
MDGNTKVITFVRSIDKLTLNKHNKSDDYLDYS